MRVKDVNFSVIFALLRSASRSVCHGLKVFFEVFDATTAKTFLGAARPLSTSSTLTTTLVPTSTSGNFDWENESIFFACCSWPNLPHSLSLHWHYSSFYRTCKWHASKALINFITFSENNVNILMTPWTLMGSRSFFFTNHTIKFIVINIFYFL